MEKENKKYYSIAVLSKAFAILELLATKPSFELNELSKNLQMPKTTVHRILLALCDEGYVKQSKGGIYNLSHKLLSVGRSVANPNNIIEISKPYMEELKNTFNETVNLSVVSGVDMVVIAKNSSNHAIKLDNIIGTSFSIFYSASGRAVMAFQQEEEHKNLLNTILDKSHPVITKTELETFKKDQKAIKECGLAYDNEEIYEGIRCLASPIFGYDDNPVAALSISTPTTRFTAEKMLTIGSDLLKITKEISLHLGSAYPYTFQKNLIG